VLYCLHSGNLDGAMNTFCQGPSFVGDSTNTLVGEQRVEVGEAG